MITNKQAAQDYQTINRVCKSKDRSNNMFASNYGITDDEQTKVIVTKAPIEKEQQPQQHQQKQRQKQQQQPSETTKIASTYEAVPFGLNTTTTEELEQLRTETLLLKKRLSKNHTVYKTNIYNGLQY